MAKPTADEVRAAMDVLRRFRSDVEHVCASCGVRFKGDIQRRYCSNACRQRAWDRRQREKQLAAS